MEEKGKGRGKGISGLMAELIGPRVYSCSNCRNNVALHDDIISKAFQYPAINNFFHGRTFLCLVPNNEKRKEMQREDKRRLVSMRGKCGILVEGKNSRAFLFSHAMNVDVGPKEDRHLMTGLHTVADVSCSDCSEVLGWKYERAYEESQKYKEGKYILEKSKIVKDNW
uniref:Yippee domain-containing protein n=1 Tax=Chenopodium quinoa TaxID=63459 RepID=A0A803L598_CHEQI